MTFAVLLDGYALNDSIRLTFSEPETVVGEAQSTGAEPTRIVFATGTASSAATSVGDCTRIARPTLDVCGGEAIAPAVDAWRVMGVSVSGISSGATATGTFTRLAYGTPETITATAQASSFEPLRLAQPITKPQAKDQTINGLMLGESGWHDGRSDGFAASTIASETLATRLVAPATVAFDGTASIAPLAYDLTRWMTPKQARNRAISYVKEGRAFTLKVNQQYAKGTAVARASSRGTPNSILAFSITYADARMSLAQSAVKIARDAVPARAVAEAWATGVTDQEHSATGQAIATATATISPDITRSVDGVRYAYAWGKQTGVASLSTATAVRWPMVVGVRQPAYADLNVTQLVARDMHGVAEAEGASASNPVEAIVTHTVWMKGRGLAEAAVLAFEPTALRKVDGVAEATAETTGVPWHWVAVPADGVAQAKAGAWGENPRVYTDGSGIGESEAVLADLAYKVAYVSGRADAGGATLGEAANVTRHMRAGQSISTANARAFYPRVTVASSPAMANVQALSSGSYRNATVRADAQPVSGEAELTLPWAEQAGEVGARHLRWIVLTDVGTAYAQAGLGRNVFKINAGDPAPDWRTLGVPYLDRSHLITASSREYRIR